MGAPRAVEPWPFICAQHRLLKITKPEAAKNAKTRSADASRSPPRDSSNPDRPVRDARTPVPSLRRRNTPLLLLDRLRPEQRRPERRLRRGSWLLGCRRRRLGSNDLRPFSALDLIFTTSFFNTRRQEGFERSSLAVEAEPHHSLRGASQSLDAVARCGPNGLEIETETTRFIVRWTRVSSMA